MMTVTVTSGCAKVVIPLYIIMYVPSAHCQISLATRYSHCQVSELDPADCRQARHQLSYSVHLNKIYAIFIMYFMAFKPRAQV